MHRGIAISLAAALAAAVTVAAPTAPAAAAPTPTPYTFYGVGPTGVRWTTHVPLARSRRSLPVQVVAGTAYLVNDGFLTAIDTTTGKIRWERDSPVTVEVGYEGAYDMFVDGTSLVVQGGTAFYAVDTRTGRSLWRLNEPAGYVSGTGWRLGAHGVAFVDGPKGDASSIKLLDLRTGRLRWRVRAPEPLQLRADGTHLVGAAQGDGGFYYGIDPATGRTLWRQRRTADAFTVFAGGAFVVNPLPPGPITDATTSPLLAYDLRTGHLLWSRRTTDVPWVEAGADLLATFDGATDNGLATIDAHSGRVLSRRQRIGPPSNREGLETAHVVVDRGVFALTRIEHGDVYAIGVRIADGKLVWHRRLSGPADPQQAFGADELASPFMDVVLNTATRGSTVEELSTSTGAVAWSLHLPTTQTPVSALHDGTGPVVVVVERPPYGGG